ncbi:protein N-terminal asparagine amidohydrolase [Oryza brachyantha]|uniref:protein N-terminal asparagine amidohydrolase n=1 Tax=Oryza brachyantha TaxID=4533 RepID=UPI0007766377|nr:protein N-terminal asparagine amidohydrolase [Oryza brachyantha]
MLLVDGEPVAASGSSRGVRLLDCWTSCSPPDTLPGRVLFLQGGGGSELVAALLGDPGLRAASGRLRDAPERRISSGPEEEAAVAPRHVYVFQREFATVDPARIQLVGTDEVTTCVGVVIRNNRTGMTSISHMDFPKIVEGGLKQMLELLGDDNAPFDVHLIGGFDDVSTKVVHSSGRKHSKLEGYSYPLCCRILEVLHKYQKQFHLRTFCVLGNNTTTDLYGNTRPIIGGFVVETSSGAVNPAIFEMNSRCPDEVVRRIRVSVSSYDPTWQGRLLETYDTHSDAFQIAPACWMPDWAEMASSLNQLSDSEVLLQCSTSPAAEPPHFVENERRIWRYLIENPYWEDTFPKYKPRVFHRTSDGKWSRYS